VDVLEAASPSGVKRGSVAPAVDVDRTLFKRSSTLCDATTTDDIADNDNTTNIIVVVAVVVVLVVVVTAVVSRKCSRLPQPAVH